MPPEIIAKARAYVRERLDGESSGHDWWHISRVADTARTIAVHEGADLLVCELAALFHDLADDKLVDSEEEALQLIEGWLSDHGADKRLIGEVTDIIATMSFRGGGGAPMRTLEGRVVQDADRLDAIGAIGIARAFAYSGHKGQPIYDPDIQPRGAMTKENYRSGKSTAINHFHEKLLRLKDRMNTAYGKREAETRHAFMEAFLAQFGHEWGPPAGRGE